MNEDSLYLKYRPTGLDEIVGNEDLVEILRTMLSRWSSDSCFKGEEDVVSFPRSILLHGPTGCGKTTLARIIAGMLGAAGDDLREVDSADFRGIDTIRDIRRQSGYKPLAGSCRVWILDEVHRLTNDAQSALLKALEDTPQHVYYILCTTDPQKLLPTVRGRCSQFQVRQLTDKEMRKLLRLVVKAEGASVGKEVYDQIAQDSMGHPRNALQILGQVLAVDEDKRLQVAKRSAEIQSQTIELCRALIDGSSWKKISGILKGLQNQDAEQIRRAVLGYCQAVLLGGENDRAGAIMGEFIEPFFQSGFPGLTLACYCVVCGDDG